MEYHPTPDQEAFIRDAIASGRLHHAEEALQEALSLWEARERSRFNLLAALDQADASLAEGAGRPITPESMQDLATAIKQRGLARLAAENHTLR